MTLDWGYADATRLTLGYHITGLPYTPEATFLSGDIRIRNADGDEIRPEGMGGTSGQIQKMASSRVFTI